MTIETEGSGQEFEQDLGNTSVPGDDGQIQDAGTTETQGDEGEGQQPKTFLQEDVDRIVQQRLARYERDMAREAAARQAADEARSAPIAEITLDQFDSPEEYAEALVQERMKRLESTTDEQREFTALRKEFDDRADNVRTKHRDYDAVISSDKLAIHPVMADFIMRSEEGPDVAYHLGTHLDEARRIFRLSPSQQASEFAKLSEQFKAPAKGAEGGTEQKKASEAPAPLNRLDGRSQSGKVYSTSDPKAAKELSMDEWAALDRAEARKRMGR